MSFPRLRTALLLLLLLLALAVGAAWLAVPRLLANAG